MQEAGQDVGVFISSEAQLLDNKPVIGHTFNMPNYVSLQGPSLVSKGPIASTSHSCVKRPNCFAWRKVGVIAGSVFQRRSNLFILLTFLANIIGPFPQARAGELVLPIMPAPGTMVQLSPAFTPAHLQGITIHPDNALQFDFLIHKGDGHLSYAQKKQEYTKLIKYFLASLTVPDKDQWVNLSPYEKGRIIDGHFGKTEMGRDLLEQDYLLKQITSSLMYPEKGLGKAFWDKVYAQAWKEYHTTNVPVNTFNKVWIIPDEAVVYESGHSAYIIKSHLKVMLEEDYLALSRHSQQNLSFPNKKQMSFPNKKQMSFPNVSVGNPDKAHAIASQVIRQVILPQLEKEVNEGKNFAQLRQIVSGMILATWYKKALKESLLGKIYADRAKVKGVDYTSVSKGPIASFGGRWVSLRGARRATKQSFNIDSIYEQYLQAFKKGVYNYIKEDIDKYTHQTIPRKYFAGGFQAFNESMLVEVNSKSISSDEALIAQETFKQKIFEDAKVDLKTHMDSAMTMIELHQTVVSEFYQMLQRQNQYHMQLKDGRNLPLVLDVSRFRDFRKQSMLRVDIYPFAQDVKDNRRKQAGRLRRFPELKPIYERNPRDPLLPPRGTIGQLFFYLNFDRNDEPVLIFEENQPSLGLFAVQPNAKRRLYSTWIESAQKHIIFLARQMSIVQIYALHGQEVAIRYKYWVDKMLADPNFDFEKDTNFALSYKKPYLNGLWQEGKTMYSSVYPSIDAPDREVPVWEYVGNQDGAMIGMQYESLRSLDAAMLEVSRAMRGVFMVNDIDYGLYIFRSEKRYHISFLPKVPLADTPIKIANQYLTDKEQTAQRIFNACSSQPELVSAVVSILLAKIEKGKLAPKDIPAKFVMLLRILTDKVAFLTPQGRSDITRYVGKLSTKKEDRTIDFQKVYLKNILDKILRGDQLILNDKILLLSYFDLPEGEISPSSDSLLDALKPVLGRDLTMHADTAMINDETALPPGAMNTNKDEKTLEQRLGEDLPQLRLIVSGQLNPEPSFFGQIVDKWKKIIWTHKGQDLDELTREASLGILNDLSHNRKEIPMIGAQRLIDFYLRFTQEIDEVNRRLDLIERAADDFGERLKLSPAQRDLISGYFTGSRSLELLETELIKAGLSGPRALDISVIASERKKELDDAAMNVSLSKKDINKIMEALMSDQELSGYFGRLYEPERSQVWAPIQAYLQEARNEGILIQDRESLKKYFEGLGYQQLRGYGEIIVEKIDEIKKKHASKSKAIIDLFDMGSDYVITWNFHYGPKKPSTGIVIDINRAANTITLRSGAGKIAVIDLDPTYIESIHKFESHKGWIKIFPMDSAMQAPGGIDLNSANLNMQIKRDGRGVPLPLAQQDMAQLSRIQGFVPVIIEIKPAVNLPILSELKQSLQN